MSDEQKTSILLVEDEENLHEALKLNLELEGYDVTSAFDGAAAIVGMEVLERGAGFVDHGDLVALPEQTNRELRSDTATANDDHVHASSVRAHPADRERW